MEIFVRTYQLSYCMSALGLEHGALRYSCAGLYDYYQIIEFR